MLRNSSITNYIENHPTAYNEIVAAVQEIPRPKPLPTPVSTPYHTDLPGEQISAPRSFRLQLHDFAPAVYFADISEKEKRSTVIKIT
jgi:hypothetical protein